MFFFRCQRRAFASFFFTDLRASPSLFDVPSFTNEQNRSETLEREVKDQSALHPAKEEQNEAVADLSWPKEETQYDTNQASGEVVDQTKEYHQDQRMPPCVCKYSKSADLVQ